MMDRWFGLAVIRVMGLMCSLNEEWMAMVKFLHVRIARKDRLWFG